MLSSHPPVGWPLSRYSLPPDIGLSRMEGQIVTTRTTAKVGLKVVLVGLPEDGPN